MKLTLCRQMTDADAAAVCEAVMRPSMRFVPVRSVGNHAVLMYHKVRELLVAQPTQLLNVLGRHLAEIGIIATLGPNKCPILAGSHHGRKRRDDPGGRALGAVAFGAPVEVGEVSASRCSTDNRVDERPDDDLGSVRAH